MGLDGNGWVWHKLMGYKFPKFPVITKTITLNERGGSYWKVIPFGKSVWNKVGLKNPGFFRWMREYHSSDLIISLYGDRYALNIMASQLNDNIAGIEINYSCPNAASIFSEFLPRSTKPIYLKLSCNQVPTDWNLTNVSRIHLNSIPMWGGGVSGERAQKDNWKFIEKWQGKPGIPPIAGCSWTSCKDVERLIDMGCEYIGIGSTILTNPKLIESLEA